MASRTCEICGDIVTRLQQATKCKHTIALCDTCKKECPGALRVCVACEDAGR